MNLKIATRRAITLASNLTAESETPDACGVASATFSASASRSPRRRATISTSAYHPSAGGLSFHTAMVMPPAVLPYETGLAVPSMTSWTPNLRLGKNRASPRPGAGDRQRDVPERP